MSVSVLFMSETFSLHREVNVQNNILMTLILRVTFQKFVMQFCFHISLSYLQSLSLCIKELIVLVQRKEYSHIQINVRIHKHCHFNSHNRPNIQI